MNWVQLVRKEVQRLQEERKILVKNIWNENRAFIEASSTESGQCSLDMDYFDPLRLSRGKTIGVRVFAEDTVTTQVVRTNVLPVVRSPPQVTMWTPVPRNMPSEAFRNKAVIRNLDDEVADDAIDLREASGSESQHEDDRRDFMDDEIFVQLVQALIPHQNDATATLSSSQSQQGNKMTTDVPEAIIFEAISECFPEKTNAACLHEKKYFKLTKKTPCTPNIDEPMNEPLNCNEALTSYHKLFCRKCFIYNCLLHCHEVGFVPKLQTADVKWLQPSDNPCTNDCYLLEDKRLGNSSTAQGRQKTFNVSRTNIASNPGGKSGWSASELTLLAALTKIFPDNFCAIAESIRTQTCQQVRNQASRQTFEKPAKKLKVSKRGWHRQDFEKVYQPCNHEGLCDNPKDNDNNGNDTTTTNNCLCINCDKFCNCGTNCKKRTQMTCNCKTACTTISCLCVRLRRECDPDVCGCVTCNNVKLQQSRFNGKKLHVAESKIHGWGAYVDEICQKGDFIMEYCGELITTEESNRRAKVYLKENCTYMFTLNADYVIDAKNFGNKSRFFNYARNPNCAAKILMVNGDHRICIYARRFIESGEELTLDYITNDPM